MFEKMKLKKEIKVLINQINEIETKRSRSQAALVRAILEQKDPDDGDVEYFNSYTVQIDELREKLHNKEEQLKNFGK